MYGVGAGGLRGGQQLGHIEVSRSGDVGGQFNRMVGRRYMGRTAIRKVIHRRARNP